MDPWEPGARVALIKLAQELVGPPTQAGATEWLRRFRLIYDHLAATVDGASARVRGFSPDFGPEMMMGRNPDQIGRQITELLESTDRDLEQLGG